MRLEGQHSSSQEFSAGATVHGSLESFQAVDLPLCLAVAPTLCESILHGVNIPTQCAGEPLHRIEAGLMRVI
jgi:hypothetical protein